MHSIFLGPIFILCLLERLSNHSAWTIHGLLRASKAHSACCFTLAAASSRDQTLHCKEEPRGW